MRATIISGGVIWRSGNWRAIMRMWAVIEEGKKIVEKPSWERQDSEVGKVRKKRSLELICRLQGGFIISNHSHVLASEYEWRFCDLNVEKTLKLEFGLWEVCNPNSQTGYQRGCFRRNTKISGFFVNFWGHSDYRCFSLAISKSRFMKMSASTLKANR